MFKVNFGQDARMGAPRLIRLLGASLGGAAALWGAMPSARAEEAAGEASPNAGGPEQARAREEAGHQPLVGLEHGRPTISLDYLTPKKPLPEQWYAGTMIGYSPAFKKGEGGFEPMSIGTLPVGYFDSKGRQRRGGSRKTFYQDEWFKQALTDRFSITIQPTWGITSAGRAGLGDKRHHVDSSRLQFNDLPVDFQYRWETSYSPSLTWNMGFQAPTGHYSNLHNASEYGGNGSWVLRYGMIMQWIRPFFKQQMRVRLWGFGRTPVSSPNLKNISYYGTELGFRGKGRPGEYGTEGATLEFGITRRWVFGLDLFSDWAGSTKVHGYCLQGSKCMADNNGQAAYHSRSGWSTDYMIGPALEYSYNAHLSAAFEMVIMAAGHNTARTISPQFGVYYAWG